MRAATAIAYACLALLTAAHGHEEPSVPLPPPPVLVVYGSPVPGTAEARWLNALKPGSDGRRMLDGHVCGVQFVTLPARPALADWGPNGSLYRAAMHGVRALPAIIFLDSKGRVFDRMEGGSDEASLSARLDVLAEKSRRTRPLTVVNALAKGGDPRTEAAAVCRALEQVPAEAWFRDYPRTMERLEKLDCREPAFLAARAAADRLKKDRETADLLGESFMAQDVPSLRKCLAAWRSKADDSSLSVADRQLILLSMVHPLWVRLEGVLYQGAHCAESEEAFNRAVAVLEEVRDMDRATVCGRRAHQLREELRKARLAAARYD